MSVDENISLAIQTVLNQTVGQLLEASPDTPKKLTIGALTGSVRDHIRRTYATRLAPLSAQAPSIDRDQAFTDLMTTVVAAVRAELAIPTSGAVTPSLTDAELRKHILNETNLGYFERHLQARRAFVTITTFLMMVGLIAAASILLGPLGVFTFIIWAVISAALSLVTCGVLESFVNVSTASLCVDVDPAVYAKPTATQDPLQSLTHLENVLLEENNTLDASAPPPSEAAMTPREEPPQPSPTGSAGSNDETLLLKKNDDAGSRAAADASNARRAAVAAQLEQELGPHRFDSKK